jgi:hypothetical protein
MFLFGGQMASVKSQECGIAAAQKRHVVANSRCRWQLFVAAISVRISRNVSQLTLYEDVSGRTTRSIFMAAIKMIRSL